ncbi:hypothetical protein Q1695_001323 [Nippostrongylus brasiliensis]|nr:hypothetical protein Q1695_001323 [Nippostrongylus brasiliensis]
MVMSKTPLDTYCFSPVLKRTCVCLPVAVQEQAHIPCRAAGYLLKLLDGTSVTDMYPATVACCDHCDFTD